MVNRLHGVNQPAYRSAPAQHQSLARVSSAIKTRLAAEADFSDLLSVARLTCDNKKVRLALVQMQVEPGEPEGNLARALDRIREAANQGAEVVLLPEALPYGWMDPSARGRAEGIPDGYCFRAMAEAARRHAVHLCTGLVEGHGFTQYNAAVLISPDGGLLLHHRKINELEIARACYGPGDRLGVADTPHGRVGVMICADGFAPGQVLSRSLALMGARVILSPCAWAVPPDHDNERTPYGELWVDNYGPVARDFGLWIAGCSNVGPIRSGPWAGHSCIGCSLIVGPSGVEAQGSYAVEETLLFDLDGAR